MWGPIAYGQSDTSVVDAGASEPIPPAATTHAFNPELTFYDAAGNYHHAFPSVQRGAVTSAPDNGPLLYHGGPIMTSTNIYSIYWMPLKLQSGAPAPPLSATYQSLMGQLAADYSGHSISSVATQYYQIINGATSYYSGLLGVTAGVGGNLGTYVDTNAYPHSTCSPAATNCVSDVQVQAELARVMAVKGWSGGLNKIFMIYLVNGEGTCMAASSCFPTFCAYHGHFTNGSGATVLYSNMPYSTLAHCQNVGQPSPNGDPVADTELTAASHEISETITDPLGTGWFSAQGSENGYLCAYKYGTNTFDYSPSTRTYLANQSWNGHYYELQMEYDNHYRACSQYGP